LRPWVQTQVPPAPQKISMLKFKKNLSIDLYIFSWTLVLRPEILAT
jgi:hypothetical protein